MNVRPIETEYKGYRFRSRLEARWAVFFDALGIKYEYEKEGYELPSGRYLPDFWLPLPREWWHDNLDHPRWGQPGSRGFWVEIKGQPPTDEELALGRELWEATHHRAWILAGDLGNATVWKSVGPPGKTQWLTAPLDDDPNFPHLGLWALFHRLSTNSLTITDAVNAARSARFEFGERGAR